MVRESGRYAPPAFNIPKIPTTISIDRSTIIPTTVSEPTPPSRKRRANWLLFHLIPYRLMFLFKDNSNLIWRTDYLFFKQLLYTCTHPGCITPLVTGIFSMARFAF